MVVHACNSSTQEAEAEGSRPALILLLFTLILLFVCFETSLKTKQTNKKVE
jgi:hypothetical protein